MVDFLESVFIFIRKLILTIKKPSCIGLLSYGELGIVGLVVLGSIIDYLKMGMLYYVIRIIIGILVPLIICLGFFDKYFELFTHQAFINGVILLSSFTTLILSLIIKSADFFVIFCVSTAIYTTCWFAYHIATKRTPLPEIKIRLKFYLAVGSSLSFLLLLPTFDVNILKTAVASLVGSFAWVTYLIEEFEKKEQERKLQVQVEQFGKVER